MVVYSPEPYAFLFTLKSVKYLDLHILLIFLSAELHQIRISQTAESTFIVVYLNFVEKQILLIYQPQVIWF